MKKPETGGLDSAAAYVALSRATCLEKLFLIEPVVLADLQHKPSDETLAALDFLNRLGSSTEAAFFEHPPTFRPVSVRSTPDRRFLANLRTASRPLHHSSLWNGHGIEDEEALYKEIMDAHDDLWDPDDLPVTAGEHARLLQEMDDEYDLWEAGHGAHDARDYAYLLEEMDVQDDLRRRKDGGHGIEDEDALYDELMDVSDGDKDDALYEELMHGSDGDKDTAPAIFLIPNGLNNCFHNAAVASIIACFDGCPLPTTSLCTPAGRAFFRTVQTIRNNMGEVLSGGVLVSLFFSRYASPVLLYIPWFCSVFFILLCTTRCK